MKAQARFIILLAICALFAGTNSKAQILTTHEIIELVNVDRIRHGLSELSIDPVLNLAAYSKARDMIDKNYFAHTSPDGKTPWDWFRALGYDYSYAGENLAAGFTNAQELETSWMTSPKHRANILSPFYSEMGVAIVKEGDRTMVVQFFATQQEKLTLKK